ncbi:phospholipase A1 PLIP1, chloroplastic [Rosa rugosa]|uniref:phospholipase A1 PLIP1, chloroplastic n=1 Tax=Rosa rugosa TaxID=74645 RepID=UPI002B4125A1|nr:phospholipase A1 PLIP1, chloroplastic [Rosa rugosa]XP_061997815.1 phospholipase A1 PLIP1, chloroplastic [Rosa rugosa]
MACTSLSIPSSPASTRTIDVFKEQSGLRRSQSSKDLYRRANIRRSYSDNHLCYCIRPIHAASAQPKLKNSRSMGFFPFQFSSSILPNSVRSFLFDADTSKHMSTAEREMEMIDNSRESGEEEEDHEIKRANWVERLVEIRRKWSNRQQKEVGDEDSVCHEGDGDCECGEGGCLVDYSTDEDDGEITSESFRRFLVKVPWSDTKQFSQLAFLSNLAYVIALIKADDLKRHYGLQFVTSSLVKKAEEEELKEGIDQDSTRVPVTDEESTSEAAADSEQKHSIHPSVAYEIAASAASYVRSRDMDGGDVENSFRSGDQQQQREEGGSSPRNYKSEVAVSLTASTMTVVVAAGEKQKQETAQDLRSPQSAPCEWFVCDDNSTYTRCFVIQGSDSLASWQANLFFEPTKFEGTNVLVHRGIYEAAKGMYEQFMPQIIEHLDRYGERAKFQFTGHSLGGSLSLLVHLMLLTRNFVKPSTLRPVVTFGSPFVFCGGQKILDDLGVDENQIHCVMMHRDIVPRAFSCNYPNHVATLLKRLNGSFRSHPCLIKNKILYSPMGKIFILQPDENSSPPHPLLPIGSALYALDKTQHGYSSSVLRTFLNSPHPLETLSDPTAYGSEGTILRDHDSSNYLKAVNGVLRLHTRKVVRIARKQRNVLWPLLTSPSPHTWNDENNLESGRSVTKEILTGV